MAVYTLLSATLILAFLSLSLLFKRAVWHRILLSISLTLFIYLYGAWVFLSVYGKYVFAALFIVSFLFKVVIKRDPSVIKTSASKKIANLSFTLILTLLFVLYFTGTTGTPHTVNLSFPFKKGKYLVFQGGKGLPTNLFHYSYRGTIYAMDIIRLNAFGNRAKHIFSKKLNDYETFGDTIYSPCDGYIARTHSESPDNIPPARTRGPGALNSILIETDSCYVFLGHLKQGCVFVNEGDIVKTGQPLGCAGNSGFSIEPHLHIQVQQKANINLPWYKEPPLFILFNGKSYLLFEEINAR